LAEFVVKFNKKRGIGEHCTLHRTNKAEGARERSPWHVKDKVLFCRGRHWPFSAQGAFCSVLGGIKGFDGTGTPTSCCALSRSQSDFYSLRFVDIKRATLKDSRSSLTPAKSQFLLQIRAAFQVRKCASKAAPLALMW
jgi:hypothetical protein